MNDCVEWTACRDSDGYGLVRVDGKTRKAHRRAWEIVKGPIPPGMLVCHRCDNPPCFNVEHLFLGTQKENMADMDKKGRRVLGDRALEKNPSSKLTATTAHEIRTAYMLGARVGELGRLFGVLSSSVSEIVRGKNWVSK